MYAIEILSWIAAGLLLGAINIEAARTRPPRAGGMYLSAAFFAVVGGFIVKLFHLEGLTFGGYSLFALIVATVCAQIYLLYGFGARRQQPPGAAAR